MVNYYVCSKDYAFCNYVGGVDVDVDVGVALNVCHCRLQLAIHIPTDI